MHEMHAVATKMFKVGLTSSHLTDIFGACRRDPVQSM
jgi:hypothetical protein